MTDNCIAVPKPTKRYRPAYGPDLTALDNATRLITTHPHHIGETRSGGHGADEEHRWGVPC